MQLNVDLRCLKIPIQGERDHKYALAVAMVATEIQGARGSEVHFPQAQCHSPSPPYQSNPEHQHHNIMHGWKSASSFHRASVIFAVITALGGYVGSSDAWNPNARLAPGGSHRPPGLLQEVFVTPPFYTRGALWPWCGSETSVSGSTQRIRTRSGR